LPVVIFDYPLKTILMRASTAVLFLSGLSAVALVACANRGMRAPDDGGGPGLGGTVATAGRGGAGAGGRGGGPGGTSGGSGGAACAIPADAGAATSGACSATFNFETDTQNAMINSGSMAFMTLSKSSAFTYCGSGALAIASKFSGTQGATIKGEVLLPLPGAPVDVTGKTITVHVASDPGCTDLNLSMVLNTQSGPMYFTSAFPINMVTNSWKTAAVTIAADAGATNALNLSLQAFSTTGYQGTIYIDEVDVR
jgi:hypothetical protein